MLREVLQELTHAQEPVNLNDLSRKLDIEPSALQGMIQFWVQKGRLRDEVQASEAIFESCSSCEGACPGPQTCPLVMKMPQSYSVCSHKKNQTPGKTNRV
jgi:hypothetical protein